MNYAIEVLENELSVIVNKTTVNKEYNDDLYLKIKQLQEAINQIYIFENGNNSKKNS